MGRRIGPNSPTRPGSVNLASGMISPAAPTTQRQDTPGRNVLGEPLIACSTDPLTGYRRNGCCEHRADDPGQHTLCAEMTAEFLAFTRAAGNDLSTPRPEFRFPGLQPGDRWCLCVGRWAEALAAGYAPPVVLEATHESALRVVSLENLRAHAVKPRNDGDSD